MRVDSLVSRHILFIFSTLPYPPFLPRSVQLRNKIPSNSVFS